VATTHFTTTTAVNIAVSSKTARIFRKKFFTFFTTNSGPDFESGCSTNAPAISICICLPERNETDGKTQATLQGLLLCHETGTSVRDVQERQAQANDDDEEAQEYLDPYRRHTVKAESLVKM
jgi:hypothetical protein